MRFQQQCEKCSKPRAHIQSCGHVYHQKCLVNKVICPCCNTRVIKGQIGTTSTVRLGTGIKDLLRKVRTNDGHKLGIMLYHKNGDKEIRIPLLDLLLETQQDASVEDNITHLTQQLTQVIQDTFADRETLSLDDKHLPRTHPVPHPFFEQNSYNVSE